MFKQPAKLLFKQLSWLLMLCGCTIVCARASAIVSTIEPSEDALSMEDVVKFFSTAFEQICGLSVVEQSFYCKFIWTHSNWRCLPRNPSFFFSIGSEFAGTSTQTGSSPKIMILDNVLKFLNQISSLFCSEI